MSQDGVNQTSMNFDIDAESDRDSDTEPTFSSISKLEPYCFEPKKSNASIEIHLNQRRNLRTILRKELTIKIGGDVVIAEQWRHPKKVSAARIKKKF